MDDDAPYRPTLQPASDHTLLVGLGDDASAAAHRRVRAAFKALSEAALPGVVNLHPAYASVLVTFDPAATGPGELAEGVRSCLERGAGIEPPPGPLVELPTHYGGGDGPDLGDVAAACGLAPDEVVREHAASEYLVHFVGFSPGFPYLGGLPPRLAAARLPTPRTRVPAGSVAIGGGQTGVYPLPSPGGWRLIGRTPLRLFDPCRAPAALLASGDRVRFLPVSEAELRRLDGAAPAVRRAGSAEAPAIRVLAPGMQTTVQDLGRPGHAHLGVSAAGAADPVSLGLGNRLVGNPPGAAGLEMTLLGARFAFERDAVIAVAGSDFGAALDGAPIATWSAVAVRAGQTLAFGATRSGARATLCVGGGIAVGPVLGSASTHLTSGLGGLDGRALRAGDVLVVGAATSGATSPAPPIKPDRAAALLRRDVLRVTRGAQWAAFSPAARAALFAGAWGVREDSDRMGLRLDGARLEAAGQGVMLTEGVSLGALQVPADGRPILSFVEHQTTGGYPQIACVIAADLHRVGQLRPRDVVRFAEVSLQEAAAARRALAAELAALAGAA